MLPDGVTSDVVVVSDCSDDRTVEIAGEMLREDGIVLCTRAGNVGAARALAAEAALHRSSKHEERCWFANTDADCEVPADWLLRHVAIASRGYAAVTGIIDVDSFAEHDSAVQELFRLTYPIHADGTHPHVHGANLGVRADAYMRAGGWMNMATGEDHDLWRRLQHAGGCLLSEASLKVITSGRRTGRAPHGFAQALAAHNGTAA